MAVARGARAGDLIVRSTSAIVMLLVAGTTLFLGGVWWAAFVLLVAFGVWFEWSVLVMLFQPPGAARVAWRIAGAGYCGIAAAMLLEIRATPNGLPSTMAILGAVIGTDICAYFFGRTIGGPKIAPKISPSKTWSGLVGGVIGAAAVMVIAAHLQHYAQVEDLPAGGFMESPSAWDVVQWQSPALVGACIAVVAQAGDFFESWMKRRAGVKDSGKLLPGHGGLFDRVDGLMAVLFLLGVVFVLSGPKAIL